MRFAILVLAVWISILLTQGHFPESKGILENGDESKAPSKKSQAQKPAPVDISKDRDLNETRSQAFLDKAKKAATEYQIYRLADEKEKLTLRPEPLLRWSNPAVGEVYGGVFAWTAKGRPEAVASIYKWYSKLRLPEEHEFHSVSLSALYAERGDSAVWCPEKPGIELKSIPEASTPKQSPQLRLQQMRSLAREFAVVFDPGMVHEQLRLLPQPLFRYESQDENLLDGGMFAFVGATDPYALLLVEARRENGEYQWQYGLARLNALPLQVLYKGKEVHYFPDWWHRVLRERTDPFTVFRFVE